MEWSETVGVALWETVAAMFSGPMLEASGEKAKRKRAAAMMGVRIKALKQIAGLYGVNLKAKAKVEACRGGGFDAG